MRALTICQPYAHYIVCGDKRVENRNWPTRYRGPLVIHAGKSREWLQFDDVEHHQALGDPLVFGAVVGVAQLVDCVPLSRISRGEFDAQYPWLRRHVHAHGPWCWLLANVERLATPVPWKGSQGLFDIPSSEFIHVPRHPVAHNTEVPR